MLRFCDEIGRGGALLLMFLETKVTRVPSVVQGIQFQSGMQTTASRMDERAAGNANSLGVRDKIFPNKLAIEEAQCLHTEVSYDRHDVWFDSIRSQSNWVCAF